MFATAAMAQVDVESIPDWYNNPPTSARKIYAAGTATGPTIDVAEKKATMDAKIQLARQVGPVSYTHLRAHETVLDIVCRLPLEKKKLTVGSGVALTQSFLNLLHCSP